ncbi:hypothetical protein D3C83_73570 [compost metagenome]
MNARIVAIALRPPAGIATCLSGGRYAAASARSSAFAISSSSKRFITTRSVARR